MTGEKDGIKTAVEVAASVAGDPLPAEPVQSGLPLGDLVEEPAADGRPARMAYRRGPGRPPGARNKRTQEMVDYLLSRYAHPLEGLLQIAGAPVDALARELGADRMDALKLQVSAMSAALPYVAQKQPQAINLGANAGAKIGLVVLGSEADEVGDEAGLRIDWDNEQNQ